MEQSRDEAVPSPGFRNLRVEVEVGPPHTVVVEGELDLTDTDALTDLLVDLVRRVSPQPVLVDLRRLTFIDSSGMAALVHAERTAREGGGSLSVVVDEGPVRRMLTLVDPGGTLLQPPG